MLQMLMGFYSVSFRLDNTILPALYVLLNLESDFPYSQSWFESFYKKSSVPSVQTLLSKFRTSE